MLKNTWISNIMCLPCVMFRNEDLIVWNGIITYWQIIKGFANPKECIFANEEEITLYNSII